MALGRRRCTLLVVFCMLVMFSLNVMFFIDLSVNHQSLQVERWWGTEDGRENGGEERRGRQGGGEKALRRFLSLRVESSHERVGVYSGDEPIYSSSSKDQRGMHVVILNQATGTLMAARVFDTYIPGAADTLVTFINSISDERIMCFAMLDEGTFSLNKNAREALEALGSRLAKSLSWRDMWALVVVKGGEGGVVGEDIGKSPNVQSWGGTVNLQVTVPLADDAVVCDWPATPENRKRRSFCSRYEGYGSLCHCSNPLPLTTSTPPLPQNHIKNIPVAIIASNRPQYLFRTLRGLLSARGANASLVTVFIDGFFQEPKDVAGLFNIRAVQHEPKSRKNGRISQHYKASLTGTFDLYPSAQYMIIIEEDLDVSLDFFFYFSQTMPLLESDPSVYCVSAWNDQGYDHSCQDPAQLYRVETMPGLGWMLKRSLYKHELEPNWPSPEKLWDWDMWMRLDVIRKGRECIIPDVSRTYHFGASGLNMNPYFQEHYFKKHTLNTVPDVILNDVDSLKKDNYEALIHSLLRKANVLDHKKNPCDKSFFPKTKGKTYVMYISMDNDKDFDHWMKLATCYHLWDLDARGFHNGLWRFWMKGNHILVVGSPYSSYASKYMPSGIKPFKLVSTSDR